MKTVFADSAYWIAVLNPHDDLHQKAQEVSASIAPVRIITSEMVLAEVLASYSAAGQYLRNAAAAYSRRLLSDPNVETVPQTSMQFRAALERYAQRMDKEWSLVDCASFLIMEQRRLREALTSDHHFEQAGFTALLT